eukprot:gene6716-10881_t
MQATGFTKNLNEMKKLTQWWNELKVKEKSKLLQVDANLVIRQLQLSKIQRNTDCDCDVCKGNFTTTPKIISKIENYLFDVVKGPKTDFSLNLNIDHNRISLDEDYLQQDSHQILEVVKRINTIFIDDYDVAVHDLPSPNDTRMMYYKKCINIQHLFKIHYDLPTDRQSGKLLFQIYLARLFSHYIVNAYKKNIAAENEKKLIKTEETKKKKKKTKKRKNVKLEIEINEKESKITSIDTSLPTSPMSPTTSFFSNQSFESNSDDDFSDEHDWNMVSPKNKKSDDLFYGSEEYSPQKKHSSPTMII